MENYKINNDLTVEYKGKTYKLMEDHHYDTCTKCPFQKDECRAGSFVDGKCRIICKLVYCASEKQPVFDLDECAFVEIKDENESAIDKGQDELDKVACEWVEQLAQRPGEEWTSADIEESFKVGAKYMHERLMEYSYDGEIVPIDLEKKHFGLDSLNRDEISCVGRIVNDLKLHEGSKVKILIVKED